MRVEIDEPGVQVSLWLHRELEANLGNIVCLKEMGRAIKVRFLDIVLHLFIALVILI